MGRAAAGFRRWPSFGLIPALLLGALLGARSLSAAPAAEPRAEAKREARLFVLMINGGGTKEENFQSHLAHLTELHERFAARLPPERITILSADGDDPRPDVASRGKDPDLFWRLQGTWLEDHLGEPLTFKNGTVPGTTLLPATRAGLTQWMRAARNRLGAGDTLLVYVTDHGEEDKRDPLRNQITLWGRREGISVRQLAAELGQLPPGVRVVTVMSQCFSGGFAFLPEAVRTLPKPAPRTAPWRGPVCGYFATTPDRPAYGCYPESHAEDRMGHAFTFIDALSAARDPSASLADLHADVLLRDQSPDVPLRSSDLYLSDVIDTAAEAAGTDPEVFADRLLAGRPPSRERATADRVARAFALAPATSLADVRARLNEAAALRDRVDQHQGLWEDALADANRAALERFVTAQPNWQSRLRRPILARLAEEPRRQLTRELVEALDKFTRGDARFDEQIAALVERADKAAPLAYRMDVREAVLLRMRLLLLSAAGRAHVESAGTPAERAELATLDECEGLTLPVAPAKTRPEPPPPYRPAAADEAMAEQIHPSWLGIAFRAPAPALRRRQGLSVGAAVITAVVPGSPAARAGLAPGDVVLGPRGRSFDREGEIRAFTMLAGTQKPIDLEVLRQGKKRTVTVALAAFPSGK